MMRLCDGETLLCVDTQLMKLASPMYTPATIVTNTTADSDGVIEPALGGDCPNVDPPLAPHVPRMVAATVPLSSDESLLGLRASARLPRFSPTFTIDPQPGARVEAGSHCKIRNIHSGQSVAIHTLSADLVAVENVPSNSTRTPEDVLLSKTSTGAFVGTSRDGEWHLLPPDRVGVRRLSFIPTLIAADHVSNTVNITEYVDLSLAPLDLTRDLHALDGVRVRAVSATGVGLMYRATIDGDKLTFTANDGATFTFDSRSPNPDGLSFNAKENLLFSGANVVFDSASGEYRLSVQKGGDAYEAKLSLPAHAPRPVDAYQVLHSDAEGVHAVTLAETIGLEDGRTAIRFATRPNADMPSVVYLQGGLAVDSAGQPVRVTRNGANLTLTLHGSNAVVQLRHIAPGTDFAPFNGKQGTTTLFGPTGMDASGAPLPGVGDTQIALSFSAQSQPTYTSIQVTSPNEGSTESTMYADGYGGFLFWTTWGKYRLVPRTDGAYDLQSSWSAGAVRGQAIIHLQ